MEDMEIEEPVTDNDDEYEEEEILVYIEIEPTSLAEHKIHDAKVVKMFGLDTKKPLLQINNQFFEGLLIKIFHFIFIKLQTF